MIKEKIKFEHGVLSAAARHFKLTQRAINHRIYKNPHIETIEYCIKKNNEIKRKKNKAMQILKDFAAEK
jgi:hypothetical protein